MHMVCRVPTDGTLLSPKQEIHWKYSRIQHPCRHTTRSRQRAIDFSLPYGTNVGHARIEALSRLSLYVWNLGIPKYRKYAQNPVYTILSFSSPSTYNSTCQGTTFPVSGVHKHRLFGHVASYLQSNYFKHRN